MLRKWNIFAYISLAVVATWLRLMNLGYSDYQGDEIKALFLIDPNESVSEFLLSQRKGPIQFLITFLLKFLDPEYMNRFLIRLPFAFAGIFAVYFFYKFLQLHFNKKVSFYATFFFATNGFLIAFARIVQYQSFVILFMVLALYTFSLAAKKENWSKKGIYLGFIFWALSILSHYDGVFIFPFVVYILVEWGKKYVFDVDEKFEHLKHLFLSLFISGVLMALFYIPFIFAITDATASYWQGRIVGTGGKIASSIVLFRVYQPIYVFHIYTLLSVFGLGVLIKDYLNLKEYKSIALITWALLPFLFLEVFVSIPGTHIYTYLIPLMVLMGIGVKGIERFMYYVSGRLAPIAKPIVRYINIAGILVIFTFIFLQVNAIFVDHTAEYPWEPEKFLLWEFHQPSPAFHLSMFGFPYYRHWDEIGQYVTSTENNGYYSTNERSSISRYHIPFNKDTDSAGHFVHIINPQSFTPNPTQEKAQYWEENYDPVKVFYSEDPNTPGRLREIVKIYYMKVGSLDDLLKQNQIE
ncbi:MAG: ArnT family glycosyltransferase [Patescibacteria group bacterium]